MSIESPAARAATPSCVAAVLSTSLLLACAPTARAAEPAQPAAASPQNPTARELDTVVVEARQAVHTADSVPEARRKLDQRAGGTAVVDGESYRDRRASTLADALGYAPGVFVQPRFGADEARVSIRGSGLQRTFHGRGITLLQDGSPLNLADGSVDFQAVEPLAARHIDVYRGANALEYGAATLGGAIDFVSPTGFDAPPLTVRAETGAFDYHRAQIAVAGASAQSDGYASLTGMSQEGYRDHAVQESYRLFANGGTRFNDALDGRLYFYRVDTRSQLPGNLTFAEYERDPTLAAAANVAMDQRRDFVLERLAGKLAWAPSQGRELVLSVSVADKRLHHPIFQVLEQDGRDVGTDLRWRAESERGTLIAGLRVVNGTLRDDRFVNVGGEHGDRTNAFDQHARDSIAYLEGQLALARRWRLSLGAQGLHSVRRSADRYVTGGRDESFDLSYSGVSPKLGVLFKLDDDSQVFANISRSLEPPSFGELTGGPGVTPVDMQKAITLEAGTRLRKQDGWIDAAIYRARIDGELLALNDAQGNPRGTVNADRTLHQGIELGLSRDWSPQWRTSANYLFNDFRFDNDAVFGDNTLAGVPRQQLRGEVQWSASDAFRVAPSVEWNDATWIDHANTLRAKGAVVWNLRVAGDLNERWRWFADLRNAFDKRWVASTNVIANANGLDGRHLMPGDGRGLYAGIEMRL